MQAEHDRTSFLVNLLVQQGFMAAGI